MEAATLIAFAILGFVVYKIYEDKKKKNYGSVVWRGRRRPQ